MGCGRRHTVWSRSSACSFRWTFPGGDICSFMVTIAGRLSSKENHGRHRSRTKRYQENQT